MNDITEFPSSLRQAAHARWGAGLNYASARDSGRYFGPVFVNAEYLVQLVAPHSVAIHRCDILDFSTSERLQRRAVDGQLNDLTLAIYYVGERRLAYLRGVRSPTVQRARLIGIPRRLRVALSRRRAVAAAVALALVSCSSSNKLITPNGKDRVAINSPESLSQYQDLVARQDAMRLEKSELQRRVDALSAEVAALKSYLRSTPKGVAPMTPGEPPAAAPSLAPRPQSGPPRPGGETVVVVTPDRVVFRVNQRVGKTEFAPSPAFEEALLGAARAAASIAIRGRTDAETPDDIERQIALGRALRARAFLLENGVDAAKIRTWYRAAGGFIADNSTVEGRASNRRVEIEAVGVDTTVLGPPGSGVRVGSN